VHSIRPRKLGSAGDRSECWERLSRKRRALPKERGLKLRWVRRGLNKHTATDEGI